MVVHAALAVVLARLSATDDIAIATPIAGRGQAVLEPLIGMFVNTLVLRTHVDLSESFADLLARVRRVDLDAFAHSQVPFESVVDAVDPVRSQAFSPLAQVALSFDPAASVSDAGTVASVAGVTFESVSAPDVAAQLDLTVVVAPGADGAPWSGSAIFATDLFDETTAASMMIRFAHVLDALTRDPAVVVGDVGLLHDDERAQLARRAHGQLVESEMSCAAELLAATASNTPDAVAISFEGRRVSYRELDIRVSTLARTLSSMGVGPDVAVGLGVPRSIEMVIGLHAIGRAGGQFVPIAVDAPAERIASIADTADLRVMVVRSGAPTTAEAVARGRGIPIVDVDATAAVGVGGDIGEEPLPRVRPDNAAYTIFTSGSTGTPKGVTVSHGALMSRMSADARRYGFTESDVFLQMLEYTFDPAILEFLRPVMVGAPLVLLAPGDNRDPQRIVGVVERHRVTSIQLVPSMLAAVLDTVSDAAWASSLTRVHTGGEAVARALADAVLDAWPQVDLYNQYGPTETVIYSTLAQIRSGRGTVAIGGPAANATAYVLDRRLGLVPDGVTGELYLGGAAVARGYVGRPDLSAERFVADPFTAGGRLYRTGDLVRWTTAGELEYVGRSDFQVKVRGQRIELEEVEAALIGAPGVTRAAAAVASAPGGVQHVVGYVSPASTDVARVKAAAAQSLPEYMVPSVWVVLDAVPLNSAGKIDRRALPAPDFTTRTAEIVEPVGERESAVAEVVAAVLGVPRVSATESFFELGGNSLSAMRLAARVAAVLGVAVSVRDVFDAPSVRALVARLVGNAPATTTVSSVAPRPRWIPLSFAQQRIWFINQFDPYDGAYNIPVVLRLSGTVDVDALRAAVVDVVMRHEVLRTTFPADDGVPRQLIADVDLVAAQLDWALVTSADELSAAIAQGFEVTAHWPLRVRLWPAATDELVVALVLHHIAADGESLRPLVADLVTAYSARLGGSAPEFEPLPVQFADFALWQHAALGSVADAASVVGRQVGYWVGQLSGVPDVLELPADRPRPAVASHDGAVLDFTFPPDTGARVAAVASAHGVTSFMVVHAALAVLLARLSATDDIAIATPIAGRGDAALEPLVGMFVNTLVLRTRVDPSASFAELLTRVRDVDLDAFAHADVPFESVVEAVDPARSQAFSPLAQVMLSVDPIGSVTDTPVEIDGLGITAVRSSRVPAQSDLSVVVNTASPDGWSGSVVFATDLFDESTAQSMVDRLVNLVAAFTADTSVPVGDAPIVGPAEHTALHAYSDGPAVTVPAVTLADLLTGGGVGTGIAVIDGTRAVSRTEFAARVNTLARELISAGVAPESAVAICIERSVDMLVAIHAVVVAGGQYVPIAVDAPADRVAYQLATAGVRVVVVSAASNPLAAVTADGVVTIAVDSTAEVNPATPPVTDADRRSPLLPAHPAYTLFTSGSTGRPKGVTVSHAAVVNRLWWMRDDFGLSAEHVFLQKTPVTFDVSVWELFEPFVIGAPLVVAAPQRHGDAVYLADVIERHSVSVVHFVPSMLSAFTDTVGERLGELGSLKFVFTSGEALPVAPAAAIAALPGVRLINMYGPTEAAVEVSAYEVTGRESLIPIGRAVANTTTRVLDRRLRPVPVGVPGELYLGGVQVARGYAAAAALTAERFVADPGAAQAGSRLYRTGDVVRWNSVGDLEYLGRSDFQVKLRGQRVELGEVEAVLGSVPGVVHAAATVVSAPGGDQHLVGYVAPSSVDVDRVKAIVAQALPTYMVPTVWVRLDDVALTASGKLDRRALPAPDFGAAGEFVAADTEVERALAGVFADVLGVDEVSVLASFFELGGNSLSAMRLAARASAVLGVEVSVREVFDAPSVRALAATDIASGAKPVAVEAVPRPDRVPLSFAQQRIWFISQLDPASSAYNIPAVLRLVGELDVAALRAAVTDVVTRHDILRTTFPNVDGVGYQLIGDSTEFGERDVWRLVASETELFAALSEGFDVTVQWPIRVRLWRLADDEVVLAIVVHHIAADGESLGPLVADLVGAYTARASGGVADFTPLPVQFADYAIWQHHVLGSPDDADSIAGQQLSYWRRQLADAPQVLELPTDRARPPIASHRGAVHDFVFPAGVGERVATVSAAHGTTPFMVLHAALAVLLARLAATTDIAIATPIAGRGDAALEPLVGMFVNTLVLRTQIAPTDTFGDVLAHVRAIDLDAFAHAEVPFEAVVEAVDPVRSQAFEPLAQVMLSFAPGASLAGVNVEVDGLTVSGVPVPYSPAQRDITVTIVPDGPEWSGTVNYATDLFDESTVESMMTRFVDVLAALTRDPAMTIGDASILDPAEYAALQANSTGPVVAVPAVTLADLIGGVGRGDGVAVVDGVRVVSRREFAARVNCFARELISVGVGPESAVAVSVERGVDMLVAVHAVIVAGGQYVPVAVDAPVERAGYQVESAGVRVVVVSAGDVVPQWVSAVSGVRVVVVDSSVVVDVAVAPVADVERRSRLLPGHPAYTLFTSGSTGRPKGVTVSHAAVVNRLLWMRDDYALGADEVFLQKTPVTFDVSVWELFLPFVVGARVALAAPGRHGDARYLADVIVRESVSVVHFVPSMLSAFIDVVGERLGELTSLNFVFASGEALTSVPAAAVRSALPSTRVVNMYGPTEAAVEVTAYEVCGGESIVPIGGPVANTTTRVLDERLRPVPVGVPGELYLGGVQVARGYAAAAALTAERFVADPGAAQAGSRLYRTGDVVRWNSVGDLEYLGRSDFQVKLRGQRVELGEVEAVLSSAPGVVHAAAAVVSAPGGDQHLVGYVAPSSVDVDRVRVLAAQALPTYMVPTVWVGLDDVALTVSGKLDRRALPAPDFGSVAVEFVGAASDAERALSAVFAGVLGVERVSVVESFFELGGNSLSAMRLAARASSVLGVEVSVREVFDAPSVRALIAAVAGNAVVLAPITAVVPRPDRVPLSFAQQRMWFINQFDVSSPAYNIPTVLRVSGDLDVEALRYAVSDLLSRHEVLRTTFPADDGVAFWQIGDQSEMIERGVWREVTSRDEIESLVMAGFDVTAQWPIRVVVWRDATGPTEHLLAVVTHHIAADGESVLPLVTDLVGAYTARAAGHAPEFAPLPVQFADYAIWQHDVLGSPTDPESVAGRQVGYWVDQLAGLPDVLELPVDRPRPHVASHRGGVVDFTVAADVGDRVGSVAATYGVTPFMVVHAAFAVLLARLSATDDIAIATPIAGRGQAVLEPLIGMFVNTLVLRTDVDPSASFAELLTRVRDVDLDAFAHADLPFESVVEAVDPVRSQAFSPLAQVALSFDPAASMAESGPVSVAGVSFESVAPPGVSAQIDLTVVVSPGAGGEAWTGSAVFAADQFDATTVASMMDRFVALLGALTSNPSTSLGDVSVVDADERERLTRFGRGTELTVAQPTAAQMLVGAALRTPDAVAVRYGNRVVTYRELAARASDLARQLISLGVGPDVAVGVCADRSVEMVIALHAVVLAGGHFVPIAVDAPARRVGYITDTAALRVIVVSPGTDGGIGAQVAGERGIPVVLADASDDVDPAMSLVGDGDRLGPLSPEHAAYTMFTSGSTGRPKGVTVPHRALMAHITADEVYYGFSASDVFLQVLEYTFDPSVLEFFRPANVGAALVLLGPGEHRDPLRIADVVESCAVTSAIFVPSMLSVLIDVLRARGSAWASTLRWIHTGGEALSPALADAVCSAWPDVELHNQYGPTETSIYSTVSHVRSGRAVVPIGRPVPNTYAYVLDGRLGLSPVGVVGELYIGGDFVARGYASQPGLTARRFVPDPFAPGHRMYRTGDLVRWSAAGELEYLGRSDFQVKVHGQRIELEEIEAVLAGAPGVVHEAAAVATADDGAQHLVGYVSPATVDLERVKSVVAQALPEYMVPSVWVVLDDVPLSSAGKIDRRALPVPDFATSAGEFVEPAGDVEARVAGVVASVLGVPRVSVVDSFFALGGNSLSAMRLAARAGAVLGVDVSVRDVFDAPSVRQLVARTSTRTARAAIPAERIPLSLAQQRMWFINQFDPADATHNIVLTMRVHGDLDVGALRAAVLDVIARQQVLRTSFPSENGLAAQRIGSPDEFEDRGVWRVVDAESDLEAAATQGFDLAAAWPVRVRLLGVSPSEFRVVVVLHHIAADGESLRPLVNDLASAYAARSAGVAPEFAALPLQFADYAVWQRRAVDGPDDGDDALDPLPDATEAIGRQRDYWREQLAGLPALVELPADRPRPAVAAHRGATVSIDVAPALGARVDEFAAANDATPFAVVHAALAVLIARLTGAEDIAVGAPVTGRRHGGLEPLVGPLMNSLILRTRVTGGMTYDQLLAIARNIGAEALDNADVPFEAVADAAGVARSAAYAPFAQIWLAFDTGLLAEFAGSRAVGGEIAGVTFTPIPSSETVAEVDLLVAVDRRDGGAWTMTLLYATDLYDESTVQTFGAQLLAILSGVLADPSTAVGDVAMSTRPVRRASTLVARPVVDEAAGLRELFARAAHRWGPRQVLVDAHGVAMTYAQLDAASNRLARWLIRRGVGPESVVATRLSRSSWQAVAIVAVAKTGAVQLPCRDDTVVDAAVRLTTSGLAGPEWSVLDAAPVADELEALSDAPLTDAERLGRGYADSAACLLDVGTGGRRVVVTNRALADVGAELARRGGVDEYSRILWRAPSESSTALVEFLTALGAGGLLVCPPDDVVGGQPLQDLMMRQAVSHLIADEATLDTLDPLGVPALRTVLVTENPLDDDEKDGWAAIRRVQSVLCWAEALAVSVSDPLRVGEPVVGGMPLDGVAALVLDAALRPVADGEFGALYVVGDVVGRGYVGDPASTSGAFVANPYGRPGTVMFATGTSGRWTVDARGQRVLELRRD
nr:non-ribosomal peptide synthetase [Gordonia asplenii]